MGNSPEYDRNQLAAKASWEPLAEAIVYFNDPQPQLASAKTLFVPAEQHPKILDMVALCAAQPGWSALINSDIVLGHRFSVVEGKLKNKNCTAACSWRFEFDPARGIESASKERVAHDNGLDVFCATQAVWKKVAYAVPEILRFGSAFWDSWMLSFFATFECASYADFSPAHVVFHPNHGSRQWGPGPPDHNLVKIWAWPVQSPLKIH
jgi:hypothetical protein